MLLRQLERYNVFRRAFLLAGACFSSIEGACLAFFLAGTCFAFLLAGACFAQMMSQVLSAL